MGKRAEHFESQAGQEVEPLRVFDQEGHSVIMTRKDYSCV